MTTIDCLLQYLVALIAEPLAVIVTIGLLTVAHLVFGTDAGRLTLAGAGIRAVQIGLAYGALLMGAATWAVA